MWECVLHGAVNMHCFTLRETPYKPQPCVGVFLCLLSFRAAYLKFRFILTC